MVRLSRRLLARVAVVAARPVAALPPGRIRWVLGHVRRGAAPATAAQALAAREAVIAVSARCAAEQGCLQRSLATALLCRMTGVWPTWCTGVRSQPFRAHAWIQVDDQPIGEAFPAGYYRPIMTVSS